MSRTGDNIYKRKDGRWEARYIKYYDGNGKAKYGYVYEAMISSRDERLEHRTALGALVSRMCRM